MMLTNQTRALLGMSCVALLLGLVSGTRPARRDYRTRRSRDTYTDVEMQHMNHRRLIGASTRRTYTNAEVEHMIHRQLIGGQSSIRRRLVRICDICNSKKYESTVGGNCKTCGRNTKDRVATITSSFMVKREQEKPQIRCSCGRLNKEGEKCTCGITTFPKARPASGSETIDDVTLKLDVEYNGEILDGVHPFTPAKSQGEGDLSAVYFRRATKQLKRDVIDHVMSKKNNR